MTDSYGRAMSDLYPSMSCAMLVVQWRRVCSLKMPKFLLIDLDFSWISRWIAPSFSCSCFQYSGLREDASIASGHGSPE